MDLETLRKFCLALPEVSEDIKWGKDLCFCINEKMFCVTGLESPFGICIKVRDEEFQELTESDGIIPAPYLARYKWVLVTDPNRFNKKEWAYYIKQSYELIKAKLKGKKHQKKSR